MADVANSKLFESIKDIRKNMDVLVVLVKTEWNSEIVDELEKGCIRVLEEYGIRTKTIIVPGAVEIPFAIRQTWTIDQSVSSFIALGCVIRGGTPHFDYVCQSVTQGITQLNLLLPVPVIFGVLTLDNLQQAKDRIGGTLGHKGEEAGITAVKMMLLDQQIKKGNH
jgi:6,7-dimethyl-8-ribityllumazine synthase